MLEVLLIITSAIFAINMGGSGIAPAFGVALGANLIKRRIAIVMYGAFVIIGALLLGWNVVKTLSNGLVPASAFDLNTTVIVVGAAMGALLLANLLHIPQSTIWVTIFSIVTLGLERGNLKTDRLFYTLIPAWIALPFLSFWATAGIMRLFYPLRGWNYRLYEHLLKHEWKLRALVIGSSCYVAIANGGNNVANVVGPLAAAKVLDTLIGFLLMAPMFGIGAALFRKPAQTLGKGIVPIGLFSASIVNIVIGTILIGANLFGVPQSLVQVSVAAVLGVSFVKDGSYALLRSRTIWRIFGAWFITPLIASALTFVALNLFS